MKPIVPALTLSIAAALVGCNSDGSMRTSSNDDSMNRDTMAANTANNYSPNDANPQLRSTVKSPQSVEKGDQIFLTEAAAGGAYEVEAGQKALMKSSDAQVKTIAQHMVDDHKEVNDQLSALAARKGFPVGTLPNADQVNMLAKLDSLNGSDFDKEYLSQQKTAHEKTINLFQTVASNSTDPDIRNFAARTLPKLRTHLDMINNRTNSNIGMEK